MAEGSPVPDSPLSSLTEGSPQFDESGDCKRSGDEAAGSAAPDKKPKLKFGVGLKFGMGLVRITVIYS